MRLLFVVFADRRHGLGHFYRTQAARDAADQRRHVTITATNVEGADYYLDTIDDCDVLSDILADFNPDWLIADILSEPPMWLGDCVRESGARLALLNGVGRSDRQSRADLMWAQDAPEKAIIRPELMTLRRKQCKTVKWFVWGGAADNLGLLPTFMRVCADWPAWLVTTKYASRLPEPDNPAQVLLQTEGDEIFSPMLASGKGVVHLGMAVWELVYLNVPSFIFSATPGHLRDAQRFEAMGLGLAYPKVGLPDDTRFLQFLARPLVLTGRRPDGKGATRFVQALEL